MRGIYDELERRFNENTDPDTNALQVCHHDGRLELVHVEVCRRLLDCFFCQPPRWCAESLPGPNEWVAAVGSSAASIGDLALHVSLKLTLAYRCMDLLTCL